MNLKDGSLGIAATFLPFIFAKQAEKYMSTEKGGGLPCSKMKA